MMVIFKDTTPINLAGNLNDVKVHISVTSNAAIVYLAHDRASLEPFQGNAQGFPIHQTDGSVELQWTGDVYAAADTAGVSMVFEVESAGNIRNVRVAIPGNVSSSGGGAPQRDTHRGGQVTRDFSVHR